MRREGGRLEGGVRGEEAPEVRGRRSREGKQQTRWSPLGYALTVEPYK